MKHLLALVGVALLIASCAPKALFTEEARMLLQEKEVGLDRIQFYNDKEIILRRKVDSQEYTVASGVIKEVDGRRVQEIRIPRFTPCVVDTFANEKIHVRFEEGEDRVLKFYRNSYNKFQIDAEKWIQRRGRINYGGKDFYIEPGGNDALLLVKKTKDYKNWTDSRTAKGIRVGK